MKPIGRLPAPKTWSLTKDLTTGHYLVGYQTRLKPFAEAQKQEAEGREWVKEHGAAVPVMPDYPHAREEDYVAPKLPVLHMGMRNYGPREHTPEHKAKREAYDAESVRVRRVRFLVEQANHETLDHLPVFSEWLEFTGYKRGRSSTTMNFKTKDGQELAFSPKGIDGFIRAIADGDIKVCKSGLFKITFTFQKAGSSVYAVVHTETFDPLAS